MNSFNLPLNPCLLVWALLAVGAPEVKAEVPWSVSAQERVLVSSGEELPFWMTSNRDGILPADGAQAMLLQVGVNRDSVARVGRKGTVLYGASFAYTQGVHSWFEANQYWLEVGYGWLKATVGARRDLDRFAGLSHSNGNMMWSGNARPLPGGSLSSNGFIPFLFGKKWLSVNGFYAEYWLDEEQSVHHSRLHRKWALARMVPVAGWSVTAGLEHLVFWGGSSLAYGELPGWLYYPRYVTGSAGGGRSPETDQINAAGNSLGRYLVEVSGGWSGSHWTVFWNHPFEDGSGLEMANIKDGLWGVHWSALGVGGAQRSFRVTNALYEFMSTLNQSGTGAIRGGDNYFNNGVYRSGYVYRNRMIGSPLFVPVLGGDGLSLGFDNTRMVMHHVGVSGVAYDWMWKGLCTWSRSFGTYGIPYPQTLEECSLLLEGSRRVSWLSGDFMVGVAADVGQRFEKRLGAYIGFRLPGVR